MALNQYCSLVWSDKHKQKLIIVDGCRVRVDGEMAKAIKIQSDWFYESQM